MFRANGSRRWNGVLILLIAGGCFTESCKKHQSASIPASVPTRRRVPHAKRAQGPTSPSPGSGASSVQPSSPDSHAGSSQSAPQLGQVLSASEQRQYNALIDQSLSQTQINLDGLANRKLTADQVSSMQAIHEFMQQANTARKVDLVSAKVLADKAQVLARDLVRNVK